MTVSYRASTPQAGGGRCRKRDHADSPQFSLRLMLAMLGTCALAFAVCGAGLHDYLTVAAAMVVVFWLGTALSFCGLALDHEGDAWLVPAILAETIGTLIAAIALFTATYYSGMFVLAEFSRMLLS